MQNGMDHDARCRKERSHPNAATKISDIFTKHVHVHVHIHIHIHIHIHLYIYIYIYIYNIGLSRITGPSGTFISIFGIVAGW